MSMLAVNESPESGPCKTEQSKLEQESGYNVISTDFAPIRMATGGLLAAFADTQPLAPSAEIGVTASVHSGVVVLDAVGDSWSLQDVNRIPDTITAEIERVLSMRTSS